MPGGRVAVSWSVRRHGVAAGAALLCLRWVETGGPPVSGAPPRRGFGSRVVEATMRDQLGGAVERRWEATGLRCTITVPLVRVEAGSGNAAEGAAVAASAASIVRERERPEA